MKLGIIATAVALASAVVIGAHASPAAQPLPLRDIVPTLEARYSAEVVAIALDESGDKAPHYHVELRYPGPAIARIDVDAATLEASAHRASPTENGWVSLAGAASAVAGLLDGEALVAALDASDGAAPHYDVDVRLATGDIARLKVDPATRRLDWRTPAVVAD